ncbi:MAG: hypothetical protein ACM336_01935 [Acidobacteriota bacterium]
MAAPAPERDNLAQLLTVRRVYVEKLSGGETADHLRDMIISSLDRSKLFAITEDVERADAVLRGSGEDLVFTEQFSANDSINARANVGGSAGSSSSKNHRGAYMGGGVGEQDSVHKSERRHEATASVRLVSREGDVIWSTTQESKGAKFKGASADVADKITRQLVSDFEKARKTLIFGKKRTTGYGDGVD